MRATSTFLRCPTTYISNENFANPRGVGGPPAYSPSEPPLVAPAATPSVYARPHRAMGGDSQNPLLSGGEGQG